MKKEADRRNVRIAAAVLAMITLSFLTVAYNNPLSSSANPALMGHSVDEMDWTKTITKALFTQICLGGVCRTTWPSMPSCAANQILKWSGTGWVCATDNTGTTLPSCANNYLLQMKNGVWTCVDPSTIGGGGGGTGGTWTYVGTTNCQETTVQGAAMYPTTLTGFLCNGNYVLGVSTVDTSTSITPSNLYVNQGSTSNKPVSTTTCSASSSCAGYATGAYCVTGGVAKPALNCDKVRNCPAPYLFYIPSGQVGQAVTSYYNNVNNANVYKCT